MAIDPITLAALAAAGYVVLKPKDDAPKQSTAPYSGPVAGEPPPTQPDNGKGAIDVNALLQKGLEVGGDVLIQLLQSQNKVNGNGTYKPPPTV